MFNLAREYGLALGVASRSCIKKVQSQGLPSNDYHFLDSYLLNPLTKTSDFVQLLRKLPAGLSEWAVHLGLNYPGLLAIETDNNNIRQTDFDFLTSPQATEVIKEEGIILLDYQALQKVWSKN